ncbi:MAG: hypothetical protein HYZ00_04535, partial [Candidatus Hydrogenedentes bacterium]|nr:hypothetical protein [Candidatus Hydrogenedentota bacterium]
GELYENVHVTASDSMYYVKLPAYGTVLPVQKSKVESVVISEDAAERTRLQQEWETNRQARNSTVKFTPPGAKNAGPNETVAGTTPSTPPLLVDPDREPPTDSERGIVERELRQLPDGSKSIKLRGTHEPDPAQEQAKVQLMAAQDAEEAAIREELARQEQMRLAQLAYEQQLYEQEMAAQAYLAAQRSRVTIFDNDPFLPSWGGYPVPYYVPPWYLQEIRPVPPQRPPEQQGSQGAGAGQQTPRAPRQPASPRQPATPGPNAQQPLTTVPTPAGGSIVPEDRGTAP